MRRRVLSPAGLMLACLVAGPAVAASDPFALDNQVQPPAVGRTTDAKPAQAAQRVDFTVELSPGTAKRGEVVQLTVAGTPRSGYHTYPITQRADSPNQPLSQLSKLEFDDSAGLQPLYPVRESKPEWEDLGLGPVLVHNAPFTWTQDLAVPVNLSPEKKTLRFHVRVTVCDSKGCLPPTDLHFEVPLMVTDAPAGTPPADIDHRTKPLPVEVVPPPVFPSASGPPSVPRAAAPAEIGASLPDSADQYRADLDDVRRQLQGASPSASYVGVGGLVSFALQGMFWGLVSLLTPCVFPMIPITVSFFLKQSEKEHHRPVTLALVYSGTIVTVLTIAAVALLSFFRWLSVNPWMNFALGALFIYFALSLFGMYDIELPSFLTKFTAARESRGGLVGTVFMALTFTMVSFACVAPFLGGFGGTAAGSGITIWHRLVGGVAFAATFAAPFFLLALFPGLLQRLPKSGSWMNSVKVVMGFLEFAAALKFLRAGELIALPQPTIFTYELVLGMYVALAVVAGLYLLNLFRLPHDSPQESVGVPRFVLGVLFLGLGLYLAPALFKAGADGANQRPSGTVYAWVDSFLLPDPGSSKAGDLAWGGNLKAALEEARKAAQSRGADARTLVFVDLTGEICTNCRLNERDVFPRPEVKDLLGRYQLVQMYTDKVPDRYYSPEVRSQFGADASRQRADAALNLAFQRAVVNDETLPTYVILEPEPQGGVRLVGKYPEAKINDPSAFAQFLRQPLGSALAGAPGKPGG